jgi:hypothetical protein
MNSLRALVETKKTELGSIEPPSTQEGMSAYNSQRAGIFTALAELYRQLGMNEAADLADVCAKAERKGFSSQGGGLTKIKLRRKTLKKRSPRINKKMKFMASWYKSLL